MQNLLVRLMGWPATILHGDPTIFDRWRWLKNQLLPGPLRTLDAGCGSGAFTLYAAKIGNQALGISFDDASNAKGRTRARLLGITGADFITADLRRLDDISGDLGIFDQIICLETIEHIWQDAKLVRNLAAMLQPGGRLYLTTPYKAAPAPEPAEPPVEDGGHVRVGYTHEELRALFRQAGLEVVVAEYVTGVVSQIILRLYESLVPISHPVAWLVSLPLRPLQLLDKPFTALLHARGYSVAVVGAKRR